MGTVAPERVVIRDAVNLCNILLDDSIRKPLVRLYFNNPDKMRIELIGENKAKTTHDITKVEDILTHAEAVRATAKMYDAGKE
jgi:hypothetical protein